MRRHHFGTSECCGRLAFEILFLPDVSRFTIHDKSTVEQPIISPANRRSCVNRLSFPSGVGEVRADLLRAQPKELQSMWVRLLLGRWSWDPSQTT